MSDPARLPRMTADDFIAWAMEQPETGHYELVAGEVVAMAPERAAHVRAKQRFVRRLEEAIERAGLPCEAFVDGLAVAVDAHTVFEPDALVRCGATLPDDALRIDDPVIVLEILSPATRSVDTGLKFTEYFRLPSLRHYLIVRAETRTVVHHARTGDGSIATRLVHDGSLRLDPPGIELAGLFG